jgi:hypothetical protein
MKNAGNPVLRAQHENWTVLHRCKLIHSLFVMAITLISVLVATILVVAAQIVAGRVGALLSTIVLVGMLAYLAPPYFSFRVSQKHDIVLIACFGMMGLMVSRSGPRVREITGSGVRGQSVADQYAPAGSTVDLAGALEGLMASEFGASMRSSGLVIDAANVVLPCSKTEAIDLLKRVVADSLAVQRTRRISIYSGRQPGTLRLFIAAHRVWPSPSGETIAVGRRAELCTPIAFPACSARFRANWFDNGYDLVYQIFFDQIFPEEAESAEPGFSAAQGSPNNPA